MYHKFLRWGLGGTTAPKHPFKSAPIGNDSSLLSGLQCNALASLVQFAQKQSEVRMQVHGVGGHKGGRHCSIVGIILEYSHLNLVPVLFTGPSLLERKFYGTYFP